MLEYLLSRLITETHRSGRLAGQLVHKEDKLVYIPILETIQILLNNVSVSTKVIHFMLIWVISGDHYVYIHGFSQVLSPHNSTDGFLRDVCDLKQGGKLPFSE